MREVFEKLDSKLRLSMHSVTTRRDGFGHAIPIRGEVSSDPFRRLVDYMGEGGMMNGFRDHLSARCEPLVRISQVHFTRLDAVVDVKGDRVRLTEPPENLIFLDRVFCKKS